MKLLAYRITGLNLYENHEATFNMYTTEAVRNPGFVHALDGAARNISISTVIGIAGINASGKTTLLRLIELALGVAGGLSLGTMTTDLNPLLGMIDTHIQVTAAFEENGRFHLIDSQIEKVRDARTPLRFVRETLWLNHGKMSRSRLAVAVAGHPDDRWSIESTRNIGKPGKGVELSADAKRYLASDRSITSAVTDGAYVDADLLPAAPILSANAVEPVVRLFDDSIERLASDEDGIHLRFRGDASDRDLSPAALVSLVSAGTLRGGALVNRALEALKTGGYLLVDELENSINKQIVFAIMDLFASPVTNPNGATLIFTTHYPELLDHLTRGDGIWFTVRNPQGFHVEGLNERFGDNRIKHSVSFQANRLKGTAPSHDAMCAVREYAKEYVRAEK